MFGFLLELLDAVIVSAVCAGLLWLFIRTRSINTVINLPFNKDRSVHIIARPKPKAAAKKKK